MKFARLIIFFSSNIFLPFFLLAQTYSITGTVSDEKTGEPLAFVNIIPDAEINATTTDIDGHFTITSQHRFHQLSFSYVGYERATITLSDYEEKK